MVSLTQAVSQVVDLARDGYTQARRPVRAGGWRAGAALALAVGALGDTVTTTLIPFTPGLREGNPVAAAMMARFGGPTVYMLGTLLVCLAATVPLLGTPRGPLAWGAYVSLLGLTAVKVAVTVHNILLLLTI